MGNTHTKGNHSPGSKSTRAIALVGPAGTGKTSLAEALLHVSGAIARQGSVAARTSVGDASPEARARGASTELNLMHFDWLGDSFVLVDTPGGAGFAADGLAALVAVDLAIVVIEPSAERAALAGPVLRRLDELGVPHAIFINKIDGARAGSIRDVLAALQPMSSEPLVLRQFPIRESDAIVGYVDVALERAWRYRTGEQSECVPVPEELAGREREERARLLETLADFDDELMEALLLDVEPRPEQVLADLSTDTAATMLVPVLFGSALADGGIRRLLKLIRHEAPGPEQAARRVGIAAGGFHAFKVTSGGPMGRLVLGRVLGTALEDGQELALEGESGGTETVRIGSLFAVQGDKLAKQSRASDGQVVAVAKLDPVRAGMSLSVRGGTPTTMTTAYPPRNASLAVTTLDRKDDVKLSAALHRLCEEDPALDWQQGDATGETLLRGINDEHLAAVIERLARRYGVVVEAHPPQLAYRESIRKNANKRARHKKQSGGHGQFGECVIEIAPLGSGEGFRFEERITGGAIPRQWIPAVECGVRDAMEKGPLGFPVVDVAVALVDGSFHSVDSSELAFRTAGRMAMAEALAQASPFLMEPVCLITVDTPSGTGSKVGSALSSRRGQILGLGPHPQWIGWERIEAHIPQAGLHGLDAELRSLSQGLAVFSAEFDHLAELSGRHADEVLKAQAKRAA